MNDPNHPDAFAVRLQPTRRTTYWDRCNSLHAGAINERRMIQRVWKEALDDYDEYSEIANNNQRKQQVEAVNCNERKGDAKGR
jgi:hypothetical protein